MVCGWKLSEGHDEGMVRCEGHDEGMVRCEGHDEVTTKVGCLSLGPMELGLRIVGLNLFRFCEGFERFLQTTITRSVAIMKQLGGLLVLPDAKWIKKFHGMKRAVVPGLGFG